jgi:hypothetical protein
MTNAVSAAVDDPQQPDWIKSKSLKEIEINRNNQRHNIVSQALQNTSTNHLTKRLTATAG